MPLSPTNPRRMSVTPATIQILVPAASPIMPATLSAPTAALRHLPRRSGATVPWEVPPESPRRGFVASPHRVGSAPASVKRTANKPAVARFRGFSRPRWYWRRQANTWLAFTPCARATRATEAPAAKVSSTIWHLSSRLRCCLLTVGSALREETASITAELQASICPPSGHNQSVHLEECPLKSNPSRRPRPNAYESPTHGTSKLSIDVFSAHEDELTHRGTGTAERMGMQSVSGRAAYTESLIVNFIGSFTTTTSSFAPPRK